MHTRTDNTAMRVTPREFGVGGRITISVMSSDYAAIVLRALAETDTEGLSIETDDVSTGATGSEQRIASYFAELIAAVARGGQHVSVSLMFSRGCPGEITCELPEGQQALVSALPKLTATGVQASAQWALYPLDDEGSPERRADHMRDIDAAIDAAKKNGTFVRSDHYVTRLRGDVAAIIETIAGGWVGAGRTVPHVTTHATLSLNSPSEQGAL